MFTLELYRYIWRCPPSWLYERDFMCANNQSDPSLHHFNTGWF